MALPALRADASGAASLHFTLDDLTLEPGPRSIARFPLGVYTAPERGGTALACGNVSLNRTFTTAQMPGPPASRDEVRACMDSEDRVVALDKRNDAEKAAIAGATSAVERDGLLEAWTRHEAEFQALLKAHSQRCSRIQGSATDRAAILKERRDAASAAQ